MKRKPLLFVIAASAASITAASAIVNFPIADPQGIQIEGNVLIKEVDAPPVSTGTAPAASTPIGNEKNTGFTNSGTPSTLYTYSTNGSGVQTSTATITGGVQATTDGNVTLSQTTTQTATATYTIEAREIKVSNPAGYTVVAGDPAAWGPVGTFYANGETLPGTVENVATMRDADGNLVSVLSDLPGVGPVTAVDGAGNPILTPAQVAAAAGGGAPAGFLTNGAPVVAPGTGNLVVNGQTTTNGIDNTGDKITNLATGTAATDAANVGQVTAAVAVETADRIADVNQEEAARIAADNTLQGNIDAEEAARIAADNTLQGNIDAEEAARIAADTSIRTDFTAADTAERNARIAADNTLQGNIDTEVAARIADVNAEEAARIAADISIRNDFTAADTVERNARIAGDVALGNRIDDEISDRKSADKRLQDDIDKNSRGIAMVAAMTNTTIRPGMKQAIDFNLAGYEGEAGFSFSYAYLVNENLQLQTAVASTTDFEEAVGRIGLSYQW